MAMIGATPTWLATHSFLDVGVSVVGIGALVFGLWWTVRRRVKASDDSSSAHKTPDNCAHNERPFVGR